MAGKDSYDEPAALLAGFLRSLIGCGATHPNAICAGYLFGSNATRPLVGAHAPGNDIDLLVVLEHATVSGQNPFTSESPEVLARDFRFRGKPIRIVFNGAIPPNLSEVPYIVDLLWDSVDAIARANATSVIQSKRPRRLLSGPDVYERLASTEITHTIVCDYVATCRRYLHREYGCRCDTGATYAIAKSALFVASVLDNRALRSADKDFIVTRLLQEKWSDAVPLVEIANVLDSPERHEVRDALAMFEAAASGVILAYRRTA